MHTLAGDLRYGLRVIRKYPGVYAAALTTLAVGIAAATTMFTIVDAVLLAPLPYADPERLALVWNRVGDNARTIWLSPPEFADLRDRNDAFADVAALTDRRYTMTGGREPEDVQAAAVSPNLFEMLGVRAAAGRSLRAGDDRHGSGFVAMVSEPVAERLFGAPVRSVGASITLDGQTWTIVGVVPRGFSIWPPTSVFPKRVDVWVPLDDETYTRAGRSQNFLHALARLKPGTTLAHAGSDVARVARSIENDHPEFYRAQRWTMTIVGLQEQLVGGVRPALLILLAAVALLLIVACANVANLLLARAGARRREMAIRTALGAGRRRLIAQALSESAVLAAAATAIGVLLAMWAVAWVAHAGPADVPRLAEARLDQRVLAFSVVLAIGTALLCGGAPAWQMSSVHTAERLKESLRGTTGGPRVGRLRSLFVVTQIACAVVLMICAALLLKAFVAVGHADVGFTPDAVATGRVRISPARYREPADRARFFTALAAALSARSDVNAAGAVTQLPMSGAFLGSSFAALAGEDRDADVEFAADLRGVTPDYFRTLGMRVVRGR
jgi:putative ABC transport system permease protein